MKFRTTLAIGAVAAMAIGVAVIVLGNESAVPPPDPDVVIARADETFLWTGVRSIDLFEWRSGGWLHTASGKLQDTELGTWGLTERQDRFRKLGEYTDEPAGLPSDAAPGTYRVCGGDPSGCVIVKLGG